MKKSIFVLLMATLALCVLFVSCNSDVTPSEGSSKDLVEVSFENNSKGLSASLQEFDKQDYYWSYAAAKTDSTGLISGQTATYNEAGAVPVQAGRGLKDGDEPAKVPGFSQGTWKFMLFGYTTAEDRSAKTNLVYVGETTGVVLKKGGTNTANVVVNPATTGNGYIIIKESIVLTPVSSASTNQVPKSITITNADDTPVPGTIPSESVEGGTKYTLSAGSYKVSVSFEYPSSVDPNQIVYATGYVIATVYPGLETTVDGDLSELVTYAQFDAEENPDIIKMTVGSGDIAYAAEIADETFTKTDVESNKTVSATVKGSSSKKLIDDIAKDINLSADEKGSSKLNLNLSVDTTEATATTITYDISMEAVLTYTKASQETTTTTDVKSVNDPVIVIVDMQTGLEDVTVKHSGTAMTKASSSTNLHDQEYFYDEEAGKLYICTASFSPFAVSYTVPEYEAQIGSVKYATLKAAFDAAKANDTITLLKNVSISSTITLDTENSLTLNLNGFAINGSDRVIWLKAGTFEITGNGNIIANPSNEDSSVIRVGDKVANNKKANLTIGSGVSINTTTAYGITVFGVNNDNQDGVDISLTLNGKIESYLGAISGNGTGSLVDTSITVNNGAVLSSSNAAAIYHPGSGTLTVGAALISGTSGIEAKAGTITVTESTITATGPVTTSYNSNGNSTTGYAVAAVENTSYKGSVRVTVNSGTFRGVVGTTVDSVFPPAESTKKPSVSIIGGAFKDRPDNKYLQPGHTFELQDDGFYHVVEVTLTLVQAKDSSCIATGMRTYWLGSDNNKYLKDTYNNVLRSVTDEELTIPVHHEWVYKSYSTENCDTGKCKVTLECMHDSCDAIMEITDVTIVSEADVNSGEKNITDDFINNVKNSGGYRIKTLVLLGEGIYTFAIDQKYVRTDLIIVGKGSDKTTFKYIPGWYKGFQINNRDENFTLSNFSNYSNYQFAGLTIDGTECTNLSHLFTISGFGLNLGFNDVKFKGLRSGGTSILGIWANQTRGSAYPRYVDNACNFISIKNSKIDAASGNKTLAQFQGFTSGNITTQGDAYSAVHLCCDSASATGCYINDSNVTSFVTEPNNNHHDGTHVEWFVNRNIIIGVPKSDGVYGASTN